MEPAGECVQTSVAIAVLVLLCCQAFAADAKESAAAKFATDCLALLTQANTTSAGNRPRPHSSLRFAKINGNPNWATRDTCWERFAPANS